MGLDETTADHATSPEPAASKIAAVKMDRSDKGSEALVAGIVAGGGDAKHIASRAGCGTAMLAEARAGDRILILGARDDTLTEFGRELLEKLAARA